VPLKRGTKSLAFLWLHGFGPCLLYCDVLAVDQAEDEADAWILQEDDGS
jgi:hypothetical protein